MLAPAQSSDRRRAIVALVLVNSLWGLSFPMMKCLNMQVDEHFSVTHLTASSMLRTSAAAWMIGIRFGIALLLYLVFFRNTLRQVQMAHLLAGAAIGAVFVLGLILQVVGLGTIPASRSGFLTSLVVVVTPIISAILKRQIPRPTVIAGALLALFGVAILAGVIELRQGRIGLAPDMRQTWTIGDWLTLLSVFFFSAQILLLDRFGKCYESIAFTPSMFATTALLALIVYAGLQPYVPESAAGGWTGLAAQPSFYFMISLLCAIPSFLAFAWMNKYQPMISAGQAAVIYTLEPVFASLWAMTLPTTLSRCCTIAYANETFSLPLVIGGALVLAANALALWPQGDANRTE
ncbi:DMT family transporter [Rosistilla carotiformis]|nr:DMT family transporter [Rosistilla carotiformis]